MIFMVKYMYIYILRSVICGLPVVTLGAGNGLGVV